MARKGITCDKICRSSEGILESQLCLRAFSLDPGFQFDIDLPLFRE